MKSPWVKYCLLLFIAIYSVSCKDNKKSVAAAGSDPAFQADGSLREITARINKDPNNATLYYDRAQLLKTKKYDSLALKDYVAASALDTNNAAYYSAVGDFLFEKKDLNSALPWIQKAIAKNPEDEKAHLKIAKLFLYIKDYPKAITELDLVLRKHVHDPEPYYLKGMVYKDAGDTARALSNFLTARQEGPDFIEATIQLGLMYSEKKDPIALKYLDDAAKIDSNDVFPIFAKGKYYQDNNDVEKAKDAYRQCILHNPRFEDAYFNYGYLLLHQDSAEKAYRQYDMVTKIDPTNPTAYFDRGVCSENMDKIKEAIQDYKQALGLDTAYQSPKEALARLRTNKPQ